MKSTSYKSNYDELCKLHEKYRQLVHNIVINAYLNRCIKNEALELDKIMKAIETLPLSWDFYKKQKIKFIQEFESLVIFCN